MQFFNAHTHSLTSADATSLFNLRLDDDADVPATGFFSIGIHPYDVKNATDLWIDRLAELSHNARCVAIGETGIDHRVGDVERQKEIFSLHCRLSEQLHKPLIIHCVRAQSEILNLSSALSVPRIFHSYARQNEEICRAKNILFSLAPRNIAQSSTIDINQILLETDDQPISIQTVYQQFAHERNMSIEEVAGVIERNFLRTFAL